ncbi:MFS transporter [Amycolatopsis aidingensis]|uniref:MFS transporter n=1 Tax=Amycolatopsis aidingensis TaxID=2842453 RepID=UPI001E2C7097|nr:MFS transporter [Amycolatopsis aidingensis]
MNHIASRATAREWIGLAVLVLPCLLVSMDLSALFLALPFLSADLEPTGAQLLWIMDSYGFLLAGLLVTMGVLGDRIGRRRLLLIGAAGFGAASILAAYADSAELLILARVLLGIGGATLAPSTLSLIRNMFHDQRQRTLAISVWTAGFAGGAMLGPVLGGLLLEHFWWGSVFLINVPAMMLLLVLGPKLLPEFADPEPGRFDLLSALLSLAAVLPVIYGVKQLAEHGAGWRPVLAIAAGLALGVVFVRRQRRPDPMVDLALFARRAFSMSLAANVLSLFCTMGFSLFSAQYLQLVYGMRPFTAAMWSLPALAGMLAGTAVAAALARWIRPGFVVAGGLAVGSAGFLLLTTVTAAGGLATIILGAVVLTCGIGVVAALANDLVVSSAPAQRAGAASALSETGNEFGGALGMAVLGSIGVAVYRSTLAGTAPPGLPDQTVATAGDTLGAATAVAARLPAGTGDALLDAAHHAFVQGLRVTALIGALITGVAAVLAAVLLREVRTNAAERVPG